MDRRSSNQFFVALIVSALLKVVLLRWLALGSTEVFRSVVLEAAAVVALLCIVDAIPKKRNAMLDFVAYLVLLALMYANLLYTNYFDQIVDPSTLGVAQQLGAVQDVIATLIRPLHVLFLMDLPVLFGWAWILNEHGAQRQPRSRMGVATAIVATVVLTVQVVAITALPASVDSVAVARARGVGAYQVASIARAAAGTITGEELTSAAAGSGGAGAAMQAQIEELRRGNSSGRVAGIQAAAYPNANVILIQVEAYQALSYNAKIAEQEVTPNMNEFGEDSWVFTNAFAQTGAGNTADAEFIVQSGLLPPVNRAASVAYAEKRIPGLPRILSKAGYRSVTMHANEATFWNRKELYPALGFDDYYDAEQYGSYDKMYRGASDEVFFSRSMDFISDELQWGKPLYATLVTMSSHAPYRGVPEDRRPLYMPEELKGSRAADWLGALSYTDQAVGEFVVWMKETGLWDDSIVILYGDHVALKDIELKGKDKTIIEGILGRPYSEVDRQRVPLMIHLPGQTEGGTIDTTAGMVDIMPTVADLVGVSLAEVPHLGRSVFVDSEPLVMTRSYFPAGSFINRSVVFMPQLSFEDGVALDIDDGQYMAASAVERADYERTHKLSELSDKWVRSLPDRPDAGDIRDAFIPVESQRSEE